VRDWQKGFQNGLPKGEGKMREGVKLYGSY
jgi:hypothetical protein